MKKSFLISTIVTALVVVLPSCKPDDEIYNPECKISKIWYRSEVGDPDETYHYDKKDMLMDIAIKGSESYQFDHNKDKTVSKIVHVGENYTEIIKMSYTKRLVDKIVYTVEDTIREVITFTRDKNQRISTITETYDKAFFDRYEILHKSQLYNTFIGDIREVHKMVSASSTKDLTIHCMKTFEYAAGKNNKYENLSQVVEYYPELSQEITRTYTYDTHSYNPFYGLPYAYAGYAGYYLNNKLSEHNTVKIGGDIVRDFSVSYNYSGIHYLNDNNYPCHFTATSSEDNIPINTYILYLK